MQVYTVLKRTPFEGDELVAVYETHEEAVACAHGMNDNYGHAVIVACTLGKPVDMFANAHCA